MSAQTLVDAFTQVEMRGVFYEDAAMQTDIDKEAATTESVDEPQTVAHASIGSKCKKSPLQTTKSRHDSSLSISRPPNCPPSKARVSTTECSDKTTQTDTTEQCSKGTQRDEILSKSTPNQSDRISEMSLRSFKPSMSFQSPHRVTTSQKGTTVDDDISPRTTSFSSPAPQPVSYVNASEKPLQPSATREISISAQNPRNDSSRTSPVSVFKLDILPSNSSCGTSRKEGC
jgi:hypothetical protein